MVTGIVEGTNTRGSMAMGTRAHLKDDASCTFHSMAMGTRAHLKDDGHVTSNKQLP